MKPIEKNLDDVMRFVDDQARAALTNYKLMKEAWTVADNVRRGKRRDKEDAFHEIRERIVRHNDELADMLYRINSFCYE